MLYYQELINDVVEKLPLRRFWLIKVSVCWWKMITNHNI